MVQRHRFLACCTVRSVGRSGQGHCDVRSEQGHVRFRVNTYEVKVTGSDEHRGCFAEVLQGVEHDDEEDEGDDAHEEAVSGAPQSGHSHLSQEVRSALRSPQRKRYAKI